ncbi:CopG family transcriptional regulator [Anaeromusa sp.]|nr:CopG family transcriptional regulator [Anaeromusa sp.]MDD3157666.1 ribbon-helix-helix domain-containing protein [Anaeromusa sp.]
MNDKALNIKLPDELYEELKKAAKEKNISLAALVRLICSEYLKNQK